MHALAIPDLLSVLTLGAALGYFGGLFGIGGGIIAIPFLALAFGMEQALAQGTSLAMMVPILIVGWWRYTRRHPVAARTALPLAVLASATTYGVAHVATGLDSSVLRALFSVFLIAVALRMLSAGKRKAGEADRKATIGSRWLPLVGIPGGACMGLLGVGGGLLATPFFTQLFGQRQTVAQSLSLVLVTPCSAVALFTYGRAHQVDWSIGLPMAIGGLLTVSAGVSVAHRLPERSMRLAFAWMILITALWMLLKPLILK